MFRHYKHLVIWMVRHFMAVPRYICMYIYIYIYTLHDVIPKNYSYSIKPAAYWCLIGVRTSATIILAWLITGYGTDILSMQEEFCMNVYTPPLQNTYAKRVRKYEFSFVGYTWRKFDIWTETEMPWFWHFGHWLHRTLSEWQLPVRKITKISVLMFLKM